MACGLEHFCLFQYGGNFKTFCPKHVPFADEKLKKHAVCIICQNAIVDTSPVKWIPSCCGKYTFHSSCMLKYAKHSGYYLKCIACDKQTEEYRELLRYRGIFVPDADALYEQESNAYADLLFNYNRCDAVECTCENGREFSMKKRHHPWFIQRCKTCGSQGIHNACKSVADIEFVCKACTPVVNYSKNDVSVVSSVAPKTDAPIQEFNSVLVDITPHGCFENEDNLTDRLRHCKRDMRRAHGILERGPSVYIDINGIDPITNQPAENLNAQNGSAPNNGISIIECGYANICSYAKPNIVQPSTDSNYIIENDTLTDKRREHQRNMSMAENGSINLSLENRSKKRRLFTKGPSEYTSMFVDGISPIVKKSPENVITKKPFILFNKLSLHESPVAEAGPSNHRLHLTPTSSPSHPMFIRHLFTKIYMRESKESKPCANAIAKQKTTIAQSSRANIKSKIIDNIIEETIELSDSDNDTDDIFNQMMPEDNNKKKETSQKNVISFDNTQSKQNCRDFRLKYLLFHKN